MTVRLNLWLLYRTRCGSNVSRSKREPIFRAQRAAVLLGKCVSDRRSLRKSEADEDFAERRTARRLFGKRELKLSLGEESLVHQQLAELAAVSWIRRHLQLHVGKGAP